ncbi:DNA/RNA helicase domain-containing protein [Pseudactinotalea terrae]|uniref:DNA/RNA helicase domain-containing protein n=1 Tax=Pseudactinotalea terrae TaxID=1743262 RepID=UPI001391A7BA|nr:DNA/RNA helicase domain-containing protein [Pseudactinotalea terrae]
MASTYRLQAADLVRMFEPPSPGEEQLARTLAYSGASPSASERQSWRASLPVLGRDLVDADLGHIEVLLEHRLPLSSKRTDAVLAGVHPRTGHPSYVVVELKQWSNAHRWEDDDMLVEVPGAAYRPVLHPSLQVAGYVGYLRDFTTSIDATHASIQGVAYLHNAADTGVAELWSVPAAHQAPVFTGQRRGEFVDFLRGQFSDEPGRSAADVLLGSAIRPSKRLLTVAAAEIRERENFILLDEQRVAYQLVLHEVEAARREDHKTAVVISGGPGSGKSVIALALLGELARSGRAALHATGSQSFTQTLRKVAGHRSRETQSLFKYFNSFMNADRNGLDVLILDEAHRIRDKSVNRYTSKVVREHAGPQIDELLDAARVPVFLLDEHQVVRPGEVGSIDLIESRAEERGIDIRHVDLNAQFRAGGSEAYISWVLSLLGLAPGGPQPWRGDEPTYSLDAVDSPEELEARLLLHHDGGATARMTAGYCWRWSDPTKDGQLVPDVTIGSWQRPWNVKGDRRVGDAPPSQLWATELGGFEQVGCVYTAQGFEYDWNGVILGPDLVWRTDRWVAVREANRDPAFRSRSAVSDVEFDRLVRNVYKVLLTRGMRGTLVYSTDPETQELLKSLVLRRGTVAQVTGGTPLVGNPSAAYVVGEPSRPKEKVSTVRVTGLTPQSVLRDFVLLALRDLGGSATKEKVLDRIDERFGAGLTRDDRRRQPSNNEVKWENQAAWERNAMVTDKLIEPYVRGVTTRGVWTLTPLGRVEADRLADGG